MKPIKCWAATSGSYSDYRICAVFATKRQAEAAVAAAQMAEDAWPNPDSVVEFFFYSEGAEPRLLTVYNRQVTIWDDGTFEEHDLRIRTEWEYDQLFDRGSDRRPSVRFVRAPMHNNKGGRLEVRGIDEQAVAQAYSDNLARIRTTVDLTGRATVR